MGREGRILGVVSLSPMKDTKTNNNVLCMIWEGRTVRVPHHTINLMKHTTTYEVVKRWSYSKRYNKFKKNCRRQRSDSLVRVVLALCIQEASCISLYYFVAIMYKYVVIYMFVVKSTTEMSV